MNTHGLTGKTVKAFYWIISKGMILAILRVLTTAVLARILLPSDFGIAQATSVITGLIQVFSMIGVGSALIQFSTIDEKQLSTAYTFSVLLGLLFGIIVFSLAPVIAEAFRISELENVLKIVSIIFPLNSISNISNNLLKRELMFKEIVKIELFSFVIGYGLVSISLAIYGLGYWALILAMLIQVALQSIAFLWYQPYSYRLIFDLKAFRSLVNFGGGISLTQLFNYLALKGDYLVVGRLLGDSALGIYGRAYNIMNASVTLFGQSIDKLLFSSISKKQNDPDKVYEAFIVSMSMISILLIPVSVISILLANEIILLLLGQNWISAVLPFQILVAGMYFRVNYKISGAVIRSLGKVYRLAYTQIIYASFILFGSWYAIYLGYGIQGVSFAVTLSLILNFSILTYNVFKIIGRISLMKMIKIMYFPLIKSILAGVISYMVLLLLRQNGFLPIFIILIDVPLYFLLIYLFMKIMPRFFICDDSMGSLILFHKSLPQNTILKSIFKFHHPDNE